MAAKARKLGFVLYFSFSLTSPANPSPNPLILFPLYCHELSPEYHLLQDDHASLLTGAPVSILTLFPICFLNDFFSYKISRVIFLEYVLEHVTPLLKTL